MTGGTELNLIAGVGTLVLGTGVLWHGIHQPRNRVFALLCAAISVWNLGLVGNSSDWLPDAPWNQLFLAGSCTAAPIGLHLALILAGQQGVLRTRVLPGAYVIAVAFWLSSWHSLYDVHRGPWNRTLVAYSGTVAALAIIVLAREVRRQPPGPLRRAYVALLVGGGLAVLGEISDFLPLERGPLPRMGVLFLLALLVIVSAVLVRYRFLDVNVYLARAAVLLAGAAMATMLILYTLRLAGGDAVPAFLLILGMLSLVTPLGLWMWQGNVRLSRGDDPVAETLLRVSRRLAAVRSTAEIRRCIELGRRELPEDLSVVVHLDGGPGTSYRSLPRESASSDDDGIAPDDALPRYLEKEQAPVPRHLLVRSAGARSPAAERAAAALRRMESMNAELVVPLLTGGRLAGWIGMGGSGAVRHLSPEVAAALMAVGNQAVASQAQVEAMERARRSEALAAVGELAAGLAHEIRNPVAAIRGAAQALGPAATPEQENEMRDVISEESSRLERVVSDFLDYARPREPERATCDLEELARHVSRRFEIAGAGLSSEIIVENGAAIIQADRDQLEMAFENLVRNAAEATGEGGHLRITVGVTPAGQARVTFRDDGPGIPEEELPLLFRPFHTRKPGGTGLGLALAHRVVAIHGGEILVDGGQGRGATFSVILPTDGAAS